MASHARAAYSGNGKISATELYYVTRGMRGSANNQRELVRLKNLDENSDEFKRLRKLRTAFTLSLNAREYARFHQLREV